MSENQSLKLSLGGQLLVAMEALRSGEYEKARANMVAALETFLVMTEGTEKVGVPKPRRHFTIFPRHTGFGLGRCT